MKKRMISICLTMVMAASLAACGGTESTASADSSASADTDDTKEENTAEEAETTAAEPSGDGTGLTIKDGVLMVGMEIGYPPMEYFDEDGSTPIGYDVDVANAIGDYLGLEVELVDTAWDGIFAGVDTDKYDCIISCVSITDERQQQFDMTKPYVSNHTVLIVPQDSEIDSLEALSGHSTAVQAETTSDEYMKEHGAELGVELFEYDKVINCFDDLKSGRTDSVFTDSVVAAYYLGDEASNYKTVWENDELEPIGICLKKGNDALTEKIDEALDALYADGTLGEIAVKHFGTDLTAGLRD